MSTFAPTERIVSYLTEELVRQADDATLLASGDWITSAERMARDYLAAYRRLPALKQAPQFDMLAISASDDAIRMPIPSATLEMSAVSAA